TWRGHMRQQQRLLLTAISVVIALVLPIAPAHGNTDHPAAPAAPSAAAGVSGSDASAMASARAAGRRVAGVGRRGGTRQTFANPSGSFTTEISLEPVRVRLDDGSWAPVDTRLRVGPDGSVAPVASVVGLQFSGGGGGPAVVLSQGGRQLNLSWRGGL